MAPTAVTPTTETATQATIDSLKAAVAKASLNDKPVADLRSFASFDSTNTIGTEFPADSKDGRPVLSIGEVLKDEAKLRALAILVAERGVVFFREAVITPEEQITLVDQLGRLSGKPESSTLHVHPATHENTQYGDQVTHISNQFILSQGAGDSSRKLVEQLYGGRRADGGWHTDITFENVPSDYASLQIRDLPPVGGDTLWASAYEAYDKLTPAYRKFLEGLTAVHRGDIFIELAKKTGVPLRENRGSPENVGTDLETIHPVIRTNPVTGWKGLFVNRGFTKRIVELSAGESDNLLEFLYGHISGNHDLQVRFRWEPNSLAIWDNRSTFHTATPDTGKHLRAGTRTVSIGERPYFDPNSLSRREALAKAAEEAAAAKAE